MVRYDFPLSLGLAVNYTFLTAFRIKEQLRKRMHMSLGSNIVNRKGTFSINYGSTYKIVSRKPCLLKPNVVSRRYTSENDLSIVNLIMGDDWFRKPVPSNCDYIINQSFQNKW